MLGEKATADVCARFTIQYGLDKPIPIQFGIYMGKIIQGDFGEFDPLQPTGHADPGGTTPNDDGVGFSGFDLFSGDRNSSRDHFGCETKFLRRRGNDGRMQIWAYPCLFTGLGLMLTYAFALLLKDTPFWLPPSGRLTAGLASIPFYEIWGWVAEPATVKYYVLQFLSNLYILNGMVTGNWALVTDAFKHLLLPATALGTIPLAIIARMTRSSMLEVLKQDYIRTARAKGLRKNLVIMKHALRNAMLPIVTIIGLEFGILFAGALLTETIFGLAGVGRILYDAITARDFPIIQAFTVVIATGYVFVNLLVDYLMSLSIPAFGWSKK